MGISPMEQPLFNIGLVARVTGVSVATLRVWELRYGFPESGRTAGGHRLYSERDIERIRWVKGQIETGMKTGQAIRAMQRLVQDGSLPPSLSLLQNVEEQPRTKLDTHADRLLMLLAAHDLEGAAHLIGEILAFYAPEEIALGVILPVLSSIGIEWAEGRMSVATEHMASTFLRQRLMMWLITAPPPRPVKPVVMACAPGEWHDGGLLTLGMLLRRRGWPVTYLGQAVPLPDLFAFVRQADSSLVVLTAMTEEPARALLDWPRYVDAGGSSGSLLVGYGGGIYVREPAWREKMPGVFLGTTLEEGLTTAETLLLR